MTFDTYWSVFLIIHWCDHCVFIRVGEFARLRKRHTVDLRSCRERSPSILSVLERMVGRFFS